MRAWSVNTPAGTGDWAAPAVRRGAEMEAPPHTHTHNTYHQSSVASMKKRI